MTKCIRLSFSAIKQAIGTTEEMLIPTWWKKKIASGKLFSDLQHTHVSTHTK